MLKFLVATLTMVASAGVADETAPWRTVGEWNVFVADPVEDGCYTERQLEGGTLVQIGAVASLSGGFFAAYNAQWSDIEVGTTGLLKFDFGDALFAGDVEARMHGDLPGGYAFFDNPDFVSEFGKRLSLTVIGPNGTKVEVDLRGSKKAIDAVLSCQAEHSKASSN